MSEIPLYRHTTRHHHGPSACPTRTEALLQQPPICPKRARIGFCAHVVCTLLPLDFGEPRCLRPSVRGDAERNASHSVSKGRGCCERRDLGNNMLHNMMMQETFIANATAAMPPFHVSYRGTSPTYPPTLSHPPTHPPTHSLSQPSTWHSAPPLQGVETSLYLKRLRVKPREITLRSGALLRAHVLCAEEEDPLHAPRVACSVFDLAQIPPERRFGVQVMGRRFSCLPLWVEG